MSLSTQDDVNQSPQPVDEIRVDDAFWRTDWLAAALVTMVSFGVYLYTLMPSVGLQDSGELVTAASLFGVPHPPSYPLWSLFGFVLTELLPIGNYAWRINLESAIFGSLTNGILALLVASSSRWLLHRSLPPDRERRAMISFYGASAAGLILGFSDVVWGQGVFAEVYTLNSFLLMLTLLCFYRWIVAPEKRRWLLASVFFFCLGVTNHPTMLMIAPAFILPVFLVRQSFFASFLAGFSLLILTALGVLTSISGDGGLEQITQSLTLGEALFVALLAFWNTREFRWQLFVKGALAFALVWVLSGLWMGGWFRVETLTGLKLFLISSVAAGLLATSVLDRTFVIGMVLAGWCGLMIFAKTPISSQTNPPMNWSYASESRGLYQSIIRGQYANNLTVKIKDFIGPFVGYRSAESASVAPAETPDPVSRSISFLGTVMISVKMYGRSLEDNFTLPVCLLAFPLVIYFGHLDKRQRPWVYFMVISFLFLAFTLIFVDTPSQFDRSSWLALKPFHILSHCMFVMAIGYGITSGLLYLEERMERQMPNWMMAAALFIAVLPLQANVIECSQRGHWFGWQYGVDMLRPLDKNAIVFGGTDPGRFVPTYMIFCESQQPARFKRDPSFDRSDLYIITQNALADHAYIKYIRDHYDDRFRPKEFTRFERWLGRDHQFPVKSLKLLADDEFTKCFMEYAEEKRRNTAPENMDIGDIFSLNGIVARHIFEQNKKDHTFYVEESLAIPWMYPHMVPAGLIMRLNPEPLDKLTPEMVAQDRKFWDAYTEKLLADPYLRDDLDAERSFSKLRLSFGHMYRARDMKDEALYAFRQALTISPDNPEAVGDCFDLLMSLGRFDEAEQTAKKAKALDPRNEMYGKMLVTVYQQREVKVALEELQAQLAKTPGDFNLRVEELELLGKKRDLEGYEKALEKLVTFRELPHEHFVEYLKFMAEMGKIDTVLKLLTIRLKVDPTNGDLIYNCGAFEAVKGNTAAALRLLTRAIEVGGEGYVQSAQKDPRFNQLRSNAAYMKLMSRLSTNSAK